MEYSVHVGIYELQLAGAKNLQYLNMGHEQFVEEMHICVAKIREILVPRSAWRAIECVLVEIACFGSDSSKTSFNLDIGRIDCGRHDAPESELISQIEG